VTLEGLMGLVSAELAQDSHPDHGMQRADRALYEAKETAGTDRAWPPPAGRTGRQAA
jgi:hypothetical protein